MNTDLICTRGGRETVSKRATCKIAHIAKRESSSLQKWQVNLLNIAQSKTLSTTKTQSNNSWGTQYSFLDQNQWLCANFAYQRQIQNLKKWHLLTVTHINQM